MADVSKIKLGATTYNIKDANAARSDHTHNYLPLSGGTVTGTTVFSKSTDSSGTANNSPALIVGGAATANHLELDGNEIMAKTDGTTVGDLYINNDGGLVTIGSGGLNVKGTIKQNGTAVSLSNHTHPTSIATSTGTNQITLAYGGKYALTAGGTSYIFTMPSSDDTDTKVSQTATTTDANYEVLFSNTADNTTRTEGARKTSGLTFNPSTAVLKITGASSNSDDFDSTNPKIQFSNTSDTQAGQLIFTQYDGVDSGVSLTFISNQTNSWLRAPSIRALTGLYSNGTLTVSGDSTFSGTVRINGKLLRAKATNLDRDGDAPSADTWGNSEIDWRDKDDERIGLINIQQTATNTMKMWITPRTENSSGSEVGNGIQLFVTKSGTSSAQIFGDTTVTGQDFIFGDGTTGRLLAKTPSRTGAVITVGGSKAAAGDSAGTAVRIGAGGLTLVGGGEYADNRYNVADLGDGSEQLYLGSDNNVYIETNGQTIADRKTFTFSEDGTFNSPSTIKQNGTAVSLVGHKHSFTPAGTIAVQTAGTTTSITPVTKKTVVTSVTKKTVVTGGSTTNVPNISKKTVVTSASGATATVSSGVLTITDGSFDTGDSVTVGTAIKAYTSLTTGDSVDVSTGDSVTTGTAITVKTGDAAYKFTGTAGTTGA